MDGAENHPTAPRHRVRSKRSTRNCFSYRLRRAHGRRGRGNPASFSSAGQRDFRAADAPRPRPTWRVDRAERRREKRRRSKKKGKPRLTFSTASRRSPTLVVQRRKVAPCALRVTVSRRNGSAGRTNTPSALWQTLRSRTRRQSALSLEPVRLTRSPHSTHT